ncbi:MAG: hypothetical protein ACYTGN_13115 [Planctomycetota bacterium]|jgi:hypothetical protein
MTRRLLFALALLAGLAGAQTWTQRRPYVGYLCAAGGQRGTVVRLIAGGQNLRGAKDVFISGEGVSATVVAHKRVPWLLNPDDRRAVAQHLRRQGRPPKNNKQRKNQKDKPKNPPAPLPDHPLLKNLESLTPKERRRVAYEFLDPARRSQLSPQIAEMVEIEVKIDARAALGERELRIGTPLGLTNPMVFFVGGIPESLEVEPNDYRTKRQPTLEPPCVFNGRVTFKDVDRVRFRARKGRKLVIEVQARRLVPYLADAVPGWFQATLALRDANGAQIEFADDYRFEPDPVVFFEVPEDGEYELEIRDAIHRGRDDFAYRITVAERPYITRMFPLGGRAGTSVVAKIDGWNLPWRTVTLNTAPGAAGIRQTARNRAGLRTNPLPYAVDHLREGKEAEPNDTLPEAQRVYLPLIVNGRISEDVGADVFRFEGKPGQEIVAEVLARRLGSPLDSLLQLLDGAGRVVAWNDDYADKSAGLVTHQADSYLRATLATGGIHYLRVMDTQARGGEAYAYRLRIGSPRPDFALIVTPASLNIPRAGLATIDVHAVRRDGFSGTIDVSLEDAPPGFVLAGGRVPAGQEHIRMTVAAPPGRVGQPIPLTLVGRAKVAGRKVLRTAVPAEEMMQAFGLKHLVPARELLVQVKRSGRRAVAPRLASAESVKIPAGATAEVHVLARGLPPLEAISFELSDPPAFVTLRDVRAERDGVVLVLEAAKTMEHVGREGNLIIEAYTQVTGGRRGKGKKDKKAKPQVTRRVYAGVLPAVPFVIVDR